jgi:hypothetical protein
MVAAISCTNSILSISEDVTPGSAGGAISSLVCNVARSPRFQAASRLLAQRSEAVKGLVSFIFMLAGTYREIQMGFEPNSRRSQFY